jgi:hypothetical protein
MCLASHGAVELVGDGVQRLLLVALAIVGALITV